MPEGGESPPPETLSGRQQRDPPASGKGIENAENKGENKGKEMKSELDNLSSNPTAGTDKAAKDKVSKDS